MLLSIDPKVYLIWLRNPVRMNYKELVNEVTRLLDEFQEDKQCIDSFTQDTAKDLKVFQACSPPYKYASPYYFIITLIKKIIFPWESKVMDYSLFSVI